jgi:hypothetical protein
MLGVVFEAKASLAAAKLRDREIELANEVRGTHFCEHDVFDSLGEPFRCAQRGSFESLLSIERSVN